MASAAQAQAFNPGNAKAELRRNQNTVRRSSPSFNTDLANRGVANNTNAFQNREETVSANDNAGFQEEADYTPEETAFFEAGDRAETESAYADSLRRQQFASATYRDNFVVPQGVSEETEEAFADAQEEIANNNEFYRRESQSVPVEQLGPIRERMKDAVKQEMNKLAQTAAKEVKNEIRLAAKVGGHGSTLMDMLPVGLDGYIFGFIGYVYDWGRAAETLNAEPEIDLSSPQAVADSIKKNFMSMLVPPYTWEDVPDVFYFVLEMILTVAVLAVILTIFIAIIAIPVVAVKSLTP